MEQTYIVPASAEGRKLKTFLQKHAQMSASFRKHLKWNGEILRNGEPLRNANAGLKTGDVITCRWREETPIIPAGIPLDREKLYRPLDITAFEKLVLSSGDFDDVPTDDGTPDHVVRE